MLQPLFLQVYSVRLYRVGDLGVADAVDGGHDVAQYFLFAVVGRFVVALAVVDAFDVLAHAFRDEKAAHVLLVAHVVAVHGCHVVAFADAAVCCFYADFSLLCLVAHHVFLLYA